MNPLRTISLLSACFLLTTCYDYSDIRRLNATCSPKDTCSTPRDLDDPELHNCDCASLCVLHHTCCIDSPLLEIKNHFEPRREPCRPTGREGAFFMVDECPGSYSGSSFTRRRCELNAKDWSDPFNNIPVTLVSTQSTYKNVFCAICNGVDMNDLVMWQVAIDCSTLGERMDLCTKNRDFILQNMVYVREKAQWGVWAHDPETDWTFRYFQITPKVPNPIKESVRSCRPNLVSDCHQDWPNDATRRLCHSYMGVVYYQNATYRNVHCALCNFESAAGMSCHQRGNLSYKSPSLNFGMLLDIDLSDGGQVGAVQVGCGKKQVFDPFAKKCRTIECPLPGYVVKDGKCAQG